MFVMINDVSPRTGCMDLYLKHKEVYTAETDNAGMLISVVNTGLSPVDAV